LLIGAERHLDRVLREFVEHYNCARPHRGIDLEVPVEYSVRDSSDGPERVERTDRPGGLLPEYRTAP
jgi:hypothetical protein